MTLANGLTVLRGLLVVPAIWSVLTGRLPLAVACFIVAASTDVLDGMLARTRNEVTELGKWLDPAMDKLFYMGLFASLAYTGRIPWIVFALYLLPQAGIAIGALVFWEQRQSFAARWPGKLAASLVSMSAGLVLLAEWGVWALWVAVAAQFMAGSYYLCVRARERRVPAGEPPAEDAPPFGGA